MEKSIEFLPLIVLCIIVILLLLYNFFEDRRKKKTKSKEALYLCQRLNLEKENELLIIDKIASQQGKTCTRYIFPGMTYNAEKYLSVFLGNNHHEFISREGKWSILGAQ